MKSFKKYLTGKRVVLVGPADTLRGQKAVLFIDTHDIVARLNHSWPLPDALTEDIGTRTDILYHNLNPKKQLIQRADAYQMRDDGVKWVVSTHPARNPRYRLRQRRFRKVSKGLVRLRAIPLAIKKKLRPRVGSANGGLIAVVDLLRFPIKRLYVTGFSFYETGYLNYPNYHPDFIQNALNHHNQRRHKAYLARLLAHAISDSKSTLGSHNCSKKHERRSRRRTSKRA